MPGVNPIQPSFTVPFPSSHCKTGGPPQTFLSRLRKSWRYRSSLVLQAIPTYFPCYMLEVYSNCKFLEKRLQEIDHRVNRLKRQPQLSLTEKRIKESVRVKNKLKKEVLKLKMSLNQLCNVYNTHVSDLILYCWVQVFNRGCPWVPSPQEGTNAELMQQYSFIALEPPSSAASPASFNSDLSSHYLEEREKAFKKVLRKIAPRIMSDPNLGILASYICQELATIRAELSALN